VTGTAVREGGCAPAVALTIAGSDSSGGAGIQADLKTFTVHGVYGASVITALTAQNSHGVRGVQEVAADFVSLQLKMVLADLDVACAKTGMLANAGIIEAVAAGLGRGFDGALIVDPVMIATSGDRLIDPEATSVLLKRLFPMARLVTPNLAEAAVLSGAEVAQTVGEMEDQGRRLLECGPAGVLIKGGHGGQAEAIDVLVTHDGVRRFSGPRIDTRHTHGSGCTLSAAITAHLARGLGLEEAVSLAKSFVSAAIASAAVAPVGHGNAPLNHLFSIRN